MKRLVFDIETVGEDFDSLDTYSKEYLTNSAKKFSIGDDGQKAVDDMKSGLGLSPFIGQIVAIGIMDIDTQKGAVYYQSPATPSLETEEQNIKLKSATEKEMLEKFWELACAADELISFNGRRFDAPFIAIRSAINGVKCTCDLMHSKWGTSKKTKNGWTDIKPIHTDLFAQFNFNGEFQTRGNNLHMICRSFGIKSPKDGEVDGHEVATLFKEKKFLDIAKYNMGDLYATRELFLKWNQYMCFSED